MYCSHTILYLSHSKLFIFGVLKLLPGILSLSGISSILIIALGSSCDGSLSLFFFGVSCVLAFNVVISSSVIAYLLAFFGFYCCFFCSVGGTIELLPNRELTSSSPDMSIRFSTTEDSWVLKRLNWVDPDKVSDYLCPSPVGRPSSLHRDVKRGRASSEPLSSGSKPVGWRGKRVRFSLGEKDKKVGKQVEKEPVGFVWGGPLLRHQGKKLRDVPWSQRIFIPRHVVQCWMEHYR